MSTDYIVVDWIANKFYTLMENTKNVKLNDLVTCTLNNTKDNGIVMFVGSEIDCKQLLIQLRKEQIKKSKQLIDNENEIVDNENTSYLNEHIIYDNDSDHLIVNGLELNCNDSNKINNTNTLSLNKYEQNNNEFEEERIEHHQHLNQSQQKNVLVSDDNKIEEDDIIIPSNKRRKITRLKNESIHKMNSNNAQSCNQCECCKILQRRIIELNDRVNQLENALTLPNEVFQWFDNIKCLQNTSKSLNTLKDPNDLQNLLKKIPIDISKIKQCTVAYSATATARNIIRALVPEKRSLAGMYLEDLEKLFGVESVNAIVEYCHLKFGEPKELIKNSISNVMSKARQYLKSKSHEESLDNTNI